MRKHFEACSLLNLLNCACVLRVFRVTQSSSGKLELLSSSCLDRRIESINSVISDRLDLMSHSVNTTQTRDSWLGVILGDNVEPEGDMCGNKAHFAHTKLIIRA